MPSPAFILPPHRLPALPGLLLLLALPTLLRAQITDSGFDSTHLHVGTETQLFVDNWCIESAQGVTRRWHKPVRRGDQPVLQGDQPWEIFPYFSYADYQVLRDPQDGLFKCWYEDAALTTTNWKSSRSRVLYAKDQPWEMFPYFSYANYTVLRDPQEGLFKCWWEDACLTEPGEWPHRSRLLYAESRDGIHWEKPALDIVRHEGKPTNIVAGHDFGHGSSDKNPWPNGGIHAQTIVLDPSPPTPDQRFRMILFLETTSAYGMGQFQVGRMHFGTLGIFRSVDNERDVRLVFSRDGVRWQHADRSLFLAPRGPGHWDAHMVAIAPAPIEVGDELWFYVGGTTGDSVRHTVTGAGRDAIPGPGTFRRVVFHLRKAEIFSFRLAEPDGPTRKSRDEKLQLF